jgi:hypothetical protein
MALPKLNKDFVGRASALGLGAAVVLTPLTGVFAGDNQSAPPAATTAMAATTTQAAKMTNASTAANTVTPEQVARFEVEARAFDYAMAHPGQVGISVLKGPDAGTREGAELAALLERGLEGRYGIAAEGYAGDNGDKPTEIIFHYRTDYTNNYGPLVRSYGPFNMGDAISNVPELVKRVEAMQLYASISHDPQ